MSNSGESGSLDSGDPEHPPIVPEAVAFKWEQSEKGGGTRTCGGCAMVIGVITAIIAAFAGNTLGGLGALVFFVLLGGILFAIGRSRRSGGESRILEREGSLSPEQLKFERQEEAEYNKQRAQYIESTQTQKQMNTEHSIQAESSVLANSLRTPNGSVEQAFADQAQLMDSPTFRRPSATLRLRMADAERQMRSGEEIAFMLAGESQSLRTHIIMVTTARLCVIKPSGVEWTPLSQVGGARARATITANKCELSIRTESQNYRWPSVEPKASAFELGSALGQGKPPLKAMDAITSGLEQVRARAKYSGGNLVYPDSGVSVTQNIDVIVSLNNDGLLQIISSGSVIATFMATDPGLMLDSATTVGRSLKGGPLALIAASALLVGPFALLAAPLAIDKKRVKQHLVLAAGNDSGSGLFAFTEEGAALQLQAAIQRYRSRQVSKAEAVESIGSDIEVNSENRDAGSVLAELERLTSLRDQGVLTEEEFDSMKRKILE